jgi:hypothetical protein
VIELVVFKGLQARARVEDVGIFSVAKRIVVASDDEGFDARFVVRLTDAGFVVESCGVDNPAKRPSLHG